MPENSWTDNSSDAELDPIGALWSEWSDPEDEEEEFRSDFFQGLSGRRRKAAFVLMAVWGTVVTLYCVSWGFWIVLGLTGVVMIQALRLILARPRKVLEPLTDEALVSAPTVSLLVAAKNEEAVIGNLIERLCHLDYPTDRYEILIVNDHSTDKTPEIVDQMGQKYQQLKVLHRPARAAGGKSGALNQALALTKGEIVGVFDADAQVPQDLLRQVLPLFVPNVGAVQVRKAIANDSFNFWTRGQRAEMALDSYLMQQRIAIGGIGELRGNGQFVRRTALERCGGWNEQTITDDLDLTIRLHLDRWKIEFLEFPAVAEEGVTSAIALWHQRNRWAEGGYQRYLDYWRLIISNRMGVQKTLDLLSFILLQYLLPTAAVPDLLMACLRHRLSLLTPLTGFLLMISFWGLFSGLRRIDARERLSLSSVPRLEKAGLADDRLPRSQFLVISLQTLRGIFYMLHWLVVMSSTTARMAVRPKRLKWVKTVHEGDGEEKFEF